MITLCNRTSRPTQSWLKSWGSLPSLESSLPAAAAKETTCWPWWTACDLSLLMDTPPRKCVVKGIIRQSVLSSRGLCPHLRARGTDLTCSWKNLQLCVRLKSRVMRARGKWQNWEVNNQECVGWAWSCRTRVVALLSFEKKIYLLNKSFIHVSVLQVWHLFVNCQTAVSLWCKNDASPTDILLLILIMMHHLDVFWDVKYIFIFIFVIMLKMEFILMKRQWDRIIMLQKRGKKP